MAINKMLHINECKDRNPQAHFKNAIDYISDPEKTQDKKNVFGINCDPETAFDEMMELKKVFNKTDKRQAYHFILSFSPEDNVSTELCNQITREFCEIYFQNRYQILIATHDDKAHMHSHMIFNSVALDNGLKYHYQNGDWKKEILPIINNLCEKYNLSVLQLGGLEEKDISFSNNKYNQSHRLTEDSIREEIDGLVLKAYSFNNFLSLLREKKYGVNIRGNTISIRPPGWNKNVRLSSLDKDKNSKKYSKEALTERIENKNKYRTSEKIFQRSGKIISYSSYSLVGLKRKWANKCIREIKKLNIGDATIYVSARYYRQLQKIKKRKEEFWMLKENNITDKTGLENFLERNTRFIESNKEYKKKLRKEKKETLSLIEIKERMKHLHPCYNSYLDGNDFFKEDYEEYLKLEKILKEKNLTAKRIEEAAGEVSKKLSDILKKERKIKEDIKVGQRCLEEINSEEKISTDKNARQKIEDKNKNKEI